jgi:hypothetical protein
MIMGPWPWITVVIAAIACLNPVGLDFLYNAFVSNEQLSRNIAQPFVFGAIVILIGLAAIEILLKRLSRRRLAAK